MNRGLLVGGVNGMTCGFGERVPSALDMHTLRSLFLRCRVALCSGCGGCAEVVGGVLRNEGDCGCGVPATAAGT